jgi:uncharacterized protein DUF2188
MAKNDVHTLPWRDGWANKRESATRVHETYPTQRAAIHEGREMAKRTRSEHFIHRRDGMIRARNTYGHDPRASRG